RTVGCAYLHHCSTRFLAPGSTIQVAGLPAVWTGTSSEHRAARRKLRPALWHSPFDFASIPNMFVTNSAWLLSGIFIMAIVVTYMLYSRHTDRYYKTLSG